MISTTRQCARDRRSYYAKDPLRRVFIGRGRGGVVQTRDITPTQLYEEGAGPLPVAKVL